MLDATDLSFTKNKLINLNTVGLAFKYETQNSQYMMQTSVVDSGLTFYHILGIDMNDDANPTKWSKKLT